MRWAFSRVLGGVAASLALQLLTASSLAAQATGTIRGRIIEAGTSRPVSDVQVTVQGTNLGGVTNANGVYTIVNVAPGSRTVTARRIGFAPSSRVVAVTAGGAADADFSLTVTASQLDAVVVTALGQSVEQRALGTAQQAVQGVELAETQRPNFINALAGRVAGVEVTSSSGVPGASSQITIRGVSSISGNNQPLMIVDGLPIDNKTFSAGGPTGAFVNDFASRGVDFTNRSADINPEDIESLVVLKGAEAAALYGIDAGNGAIVITTKRGKAGASGFDYTNSFRMEQTRARPEIQRVYGQSAVGSTTLLYYGDRYPEGTTLYDNVDGFFQTAVSQKHQLAFSGATADSRVNYRLSMASNRSQGVVPNSLDQKLNLTGASGAQVKDWLKVDLTMGYSYQNNDQPFKGLGGPLIGLLVWPQIDNASEYLTATGNRRRLTNLSAAAEVDNPYFNVEKNGINARNNRLISNLQFLFTPFRWGSLQTNIGVDNFTTQNQIVRHPESAYGVGANGILDIANDVTRNLSSQTLLSFKRREFTSDIGLTATLGNQIRDDKSTIDAAAGRDFLEPNFVSMNNTNIRTGRTLISQRRLIGLFGSATLDFKRYLYVTVTGRNDWTSTIPPERNSFFYPSISTSFIFSDAIPQLGDFMTGKLRLAYAEVGKDARPYAYKAGLEYKTSSYGGFGYGFSGPNPGLRPEFKRSYEGGLETSFLNDRLGVDLTLYRAQTKDQIVNDLRASYGSGFILINLNGAETRNEGIELTVRGTPLQGQRLTWDIIANFDKTRGVVLKLPEEVPEFYISDTWLYGYVRNGTSAGKSTRSLTGLFYLRNNEGKLLINPTTGLPERSPGPQFTDAGYDRAPDFLLGITNSFRRGPVSLSFLVDIRKGGDILNATEHFLTARGLSMRTLDREEPRVIDGVLRDGKENTANPTPNNIVVVPAVNTAYYTTISEELFIEQDINWLRLRDVTLNYTLPNRFGARRASVFVTGTDLYLLTNYSGLDPVVNGNTAAVGGSGAAGIDYGNFPIPRGLNFGLKMAF